MKVGLIDVDGHNYPNLSLMKISAHHKASGDDVEWYWGFGEYDRVYMSKVFSTTYSADALEPVNAGEIIKGGSGYAITTERGVECYDKEKDPDLPPCVARMMPDYSIYPDLTNECAYGRLTVGCPKKCAWCHVGKMQGEQTRQIAEIGEFWNGQKTIELLDPNILAAPNREDLLFELAKTKAAINFNQGLDVQRCDEEILSLLNKAKIKTYHFAWDDPTMDLADQFAFVGDRLRIKSRAKRMVYVLTNFGASTLENALERIYILRSLNFDPYVMIYDKPNAPPELRDLQRWCNNKFIFGAEPDFDKYNAKERGNET